MIERYTREAMGKIWQDENRFGKWLEIEILACEAWEKKGVIPEKAVEVIKKKADFNVDRILEIEETTRHDVIAFLTCVAEYVGPESRYIHYGMTSSDILDTTISLQLVEASDILLDGLKKLADVFKRLAIEHKNTVMIGRSHGIHAEPTTFGLKMALYYEETKRNIERLEQARENICVGQVSGPVGTFSNVDPCIEEYVCEKLGLKPAKVSTQIIQRDRHAQYLTTLAVISSSIEKFAV